MVTRRPRGGAKREGPFIAEGRRIASARERAGFRSQGALANAIGEKSRQTVGRWELGTISVPERKRAKLAAVLHEAESFLWPRGDYVPQKPGQAAVREVPRGTFGDIQTQSDIKGRWPAGWMKRATDLFAEASAAGATDDEIAQVQELMLDPVVKLGIGQASAHATIRDLERIEAGARAWLNGRGRRVQSHEPAPAPRTIGERIRIAREERNWSSAELARKAGMRTAKPIEQLELPSPQKIPRELLDRVAAALGIPTEELIGSDR